MGWSIHKIGADQEELTGHSLRLLKNVKPDRLLHFCFSKEGANLRIPSVYILSRTAPT